MNPPPDDLSEARRIADQYAWASYQEPCMKAIASALDRAKEKAWQRGSDETRYSIMVPPNPYQSAPFDKEKAE